MESPSHAALKRLARAFLLRVGCCAAATEVTCPISRHRLDAAGYADRPAALPAPGERALATLWSLESTMRLSRPALPAKAAGPATGQTIVIECKRSRSDFFRDGECIEELLALRDRLRARRAEIEETLIKRLEPHLRRSGAALFPELEEWDFPASRLAAYRAVLRSLRDVERRLYGQTKFDRMRRYRLADQLLLLTPSGLVRRQELPEGWGLIEAARPGLRQAATGPLDDLPLRVTVSAPRLDSSVQRRQRLLRNIAVALTRSYLAS